MAPAIQIRHATVDDAAAISVLILPITAKFIEPDLSAEGVNTLRQTMAAEAIAGRIDEGFRYHVAEQDDKLIGVIGTRDNRHLYALFVAEAFQRQGVATRLWSVARQACTDAGGPGEFTVNSSRYAVAVYQRLGFAATGPPVEQNGLIFTPMRLAQKRERESSQSLSGNQSGK